MKNPDELRTILANERTLLAYVRTMAIAVFGMAAIKLFPETPLVVSAGWIAVAAGIILLARGVVHIRKLSERIIKAREMKYLFDEWDKLKRG